MTSKASMNPALRHVWSKPSRYKIVYGGRASSKSWDAAANAIRIARATQVRVLCTRMFQNKIEESVYNLLKSQADRFGVAHEFEFQKAKIKHLKTGSEFLFYGLARNIDEIKSLEGVDICWLEEAHAVTRDMWEVIEPTIRKAGSEFWVIFNPRLVSDFCYQYFVATPPDGAVVRKINYPENPFLSDTMLSTIESYRQRNPEDFEHVYLGVPRNDDDAAVIKRTWLEAAVDAHIKLGIAPAGPKVVGFDVADDGGDKNASVVAHGQVALHVRQWKGLEDKLLASCSSVYQEAIEHGAEINYDSIGVGASAGAKFSELNEAQGKRVKFHKFNAGGKVLNPDREFMPGTLNKDHFSNLKAQAWWTVSDRLRITYEAVVNGVECDPAAIISISSQCNHLEQLITELSTPHRDFDPSGRVKVESKKDLAKRDVRSPNLADAFIMAYAPRERKGHGGMRRIGGLA